RLRAIAAWPRGISARGVATLQRAIDPRLPAAVDVPEAPVQVTARVSATGQTAARLRDLDLSMWVFSPRGGSAIVDLGRLRAGTFTYRGQLSGLCPSGCRMSGLGVLPVGGRA